MQNNVAIQNDRRISSSGGLNMERKSSRNYFETRGIDIELVLMLSVTETVIQ